jgi:lysozyme
MRPSLGVFGASCAAVLISACFMSSGVSHAQEQLALEQDQSRAELFNLLIERLRAQADPSQKNLFRPRGFAFPRDAIWDDPDKDVNPRKNSIFGIDVSHHNDRDCGCKLDWGAIQAQKIAFAYVKASQGTKYVDDRFAEHWRDIKSLPADKLILRGAYHFLSADGLGEAQAQNFLGVLGRAFEPSDMPPTLDLEWDVRIANGKIILGPDGKARDFWDNTSPQDILDRTLAWLKAVAAATGRIPLVYTNRVWWLERIKDEEKFAALGRYKIWIADYSKSGRATEKPAVPSQSAWHLWQFTAAAKFTSGGLSTAVDANIFKGTDKEFRAAFGLR